MTTDRPDPTSHPDDELASAHLDGATTPEEAARVESDPALLARVEVLRSVRAAVALPDRPVDPARRDAAIAAALAAVADEDAVLSLSMARARRRQKVAVRAAGLAVAAAVAAAFALPRLDADDHRAPDVVASPEGGTEADADESQVLSSELAPDDLSRESTMEINILTVEQASDLGSAADAASLAATAAAVLDGRSSLPAAPQPADPTAANECLAALQADALPVILVAVGEVAGRPVVAVVVAEPEGGRHLDVAAVDGCERLGSFPI